MVSHFAQQMSQFWIFIFWIKPEIMIGVNDLTCNLEICKKLVSMLIFFIQNITKDSGLFIKFCQKFCCSGINLFDLFKKLISPFYFNCKTTMFAALFLKVIWPNVVFPDFFYCSIDLWIW